MFFFKLLLCNNDCTSFVINGVVLINYMKNIVSESSSHLKFISVGFVNCSCIDGKQMSIVNMSH